MEKQSFYWVLILLMGIVTTNAQTPKSEFHKTIDSINGIIKTSRLAYYMHNKQSGEFITKISATEQGIVSFTDSIPNVPEPEISEKRKPVLISDCCPRKNARKLALFSIKNWEFAYPYLNLKDKNNEIFARFIGFKKPTLTKLKELFEKLRTFCKQEQTTDK